MKSRLKKYPVVGGPLAGKQLSSDDFAPEHRSHVNIPYKQPPVHVGDVVKTAGFYHDQSEDYVPYNRSGNGHMALTRGPVRRTIPTMVWIYRPLLEGAT